MNELRPAAPPYLLDWLRSLWRISSASLSSASRSFLAFSSFSLCSLISCARFAMAIFARSSLERNLGYTTHISRDKSVQLAIKIPWMQLPFPVSAFVARIRSKEAQPALALWQVLKTRQTHSGSRARGRPTCSESRPLDGLRL